MFLKKKKELSELSVLVELINEMEKKGLNNPEYIVRNIELISNIIEILKGFKNELIDLAGKS
tara:strand:- start:555 stop:740 length:186 start_codon:yes stop_codon:yes gene_type:complete